MFWKKLEKEERETRKKADKEAIEKRKREEEIKEAKRQQRKLNFLLQQTELYSHFLGKKMGNIDMKATTPVESNINMDEISEIEDEAVLKQAAYAEAQKAFQIHIEKTRQFDENVNQIRGINREYFSYFIIFLK